MVLGLICLNTFHILWHIYTLWLSSCLSSSFLSVITPVCLSCLLTCQACYVSADVPTCLSSSSIVFLCFFVSSLCLSGPLFVSFATGLSLNLSVSYLFIYCLICLSGIQRLVGGPAAELHCKVLGWLEGTLFQWRCAASNILFVVGCEADLSRLLSCWHSDSLWLAAGRNDTHHHQRR